MGNASPCPRCGGTCTWDEAHTQNDPDEPEDDDNEDNEEED